jgi:hypothetical protein
MAHGTSNRRIVARQITEAFSRNEAPRSTIQDRDCVYGAIITRRLRAMGTRDKPIAPASPWQNGFAERLIGLIRRECADHIIVLGEAHLRRIRKSYACCYMRRGPTWPWIRMPPVSRPVQRTGGSAHLPSWADFVTTTSGFRFSVHAGGTSPIVCSFPATPDHGSTNHLLANH